MKISRPLMYNSVQERSANGVYTDRITLCNVVSPRLARHLRIHASSCHLALLLLDVPGALHCGSCMAQYISSWVVADPHSLCQ
jgi:hypothetical protein